MAKTETPLLDRLAVRLLHMPSPHWALTDDKRYVADLIARMRAMHGRYEREPKLPARGDGLVRDFDHDRLCDEASAAIEKYSDEFGTPRGYVSTPLADRKRDPLPGETFVSPRRAGAGA